MTLVNIVREIDILFAKNIFWLPILFCVPRTTDKMKKFLSSIFYFCFACQTNSHCEYFLLNVYNKWYATSLTGNVIPYCRIGLSNHHTYNIIYNHTIIYNSTTTTIYNYINLYTSMSSTIFRSVCSLLPYSLKISVEAFIVRWHQADWMMDSIVILLFMCTSTYRGTLVKSDNAVFF